MVFPFPRPFPGPSMVSFNVLSLFSSGEQGAWYDPSDFLANWRRNLLTRTEEFNNAAWTKNFILPFGSGSIANATASPSGAVSADKIVVDTNNGLHVLYNTTAIPVVVSTNYTGSVYVKAAEYGFAFVALNVRASSSNCGVCVNLSDGAQTNGGANGTYTVTSAGNGWWLVSVSAIASSTNGYLEVTPRSTAGGPVGYTGDGTSGIYLWGAQLELGSSATDYQKITDGVADYFTVQPQPVMFQDSAGTTPVTAVEQPVGLILDKSKGLAIGSNVFTGWSRNATLESGTTLPAACTSTVASGLCGLFITPVPINKTYKVDITWSGLTAGRTLIAGGGAWVQNVSTAASGTATVYVTAATAVNFYVYFNPNAIGQTVTLESISVRELPGNHASQATSTSRPVLSARVNLLTYSEQFDNAAWSKNALLAFGSGSVANAVSAPDGTLTADLIVENTASSTHNVSAIFTCVSGTAYTWSAHVKPAGRTIVRMVNQATAVIYDVEFDLSGAGSSTNRSGTGTAAITALANGWYRISATATATAGGTGYWQINLGNVPNNTTYTGDGTSGVYLWGADVRVTNDGVGIPAYQRINAATDYDTSGFPLYLAFDGVDDSLATASVDFSATDKMSVFAGVRKLSDAADGMVYQMGDASALQSGAFELTAPGSSTVTKFQFLSRGTVNAIPFTTSTTYNAPYTGVIAGLGDISGDAATLRINGAQIAQILTDQGTGNYGNYPLYIGRRAGTSLPYNGRLYSLIVRGASTNADQLARTETWVNNITKAY